MITVHHLESSRSYRIIWLLEELGLSYQITHHRKNGDNARPEPSLQDIHPLGMAPVLKDKGLTLLESGAITEYLLNHYDRTCLRPPVASADFNQYTFWMHFAEGSLMPELSKHQAFLKTGTTRVPFFARSILKKVVTGVIGASITPKIEVMLNYIDTELSKNGWFCGSQFTAADIQMSFPLELAEAHGLIGSNMSNITSFLAAIRERAAYKIAQEKTGAVTLTLPMTEPSDEKEADEQEDGTNNSIPEEIETKKEQP
ncbi:MAG: glutathione S-transferase [Alcaligenaceae bacterium]|nr:glutathione S-transferase [Alcaligenaceae bacterium]